MQTPYNFTCAHITSPDGTNIRPILRVMTAIYSRDSTLIHVSAVYLRLLGYTGPFGKNIAAVRRVLRKNFPKDCWIGARVKNPNLRSLFVTARCARRLYMYTPAPPQTYALHEHMVTLAAVYARRRIIQGNIIWFEPLQVGPRDLAVPTIIGAGPFADFQLYRTGKQNLSVIPCDTAVNMAIAIVKRFPRDAHGRTMLSADDLERVILSLELIEPPYSYELF